MQLWYGDIPCLNICNLAIVAFYCGKHLQQSFAHFGPIHIWKGEMAPGYLCPLIGAINTAVAPGKSNCAPSLSERPWIRVESEITWMPYHAPVRLVVVCLQTDDDHINNKSSSERLRFLWKTVIRTVELRNYSAVNETLNGLGPRRRPEPCLSA